MIKFFIIDLILFKKAAKAIF